jgi:hypothetical protein
MGGVASLLPCADTRNFLRERRTRLYFNAQPATHAA